MIKVEERGEELILISLLFKLLSCYKVFKKDMFNQDDYKDQIIEN